MNPDIEAAWIELENDISEAAISGRVENWLNLYKELITAAKQHDYLQNYFPLTSHYRLRFSMDKHLHESWPFFYSVEPLLDEKKYKYKVHISIEDTEARYFSDAYSALEFLTDLMRNIKPTKWK
ncbi:MAG: hypothetical protein MUD08_11545 [Cytophagales bacterium]|jgi:hypothetical protein|nr:hypothetical protein [Cytophagales bacterium]